MVAFGHFERPIDGKVGAGAHEVSNRLQTDFGLQAAMLLHDTFDALRIQAR